MRFSNLSVPSGVAFVLLLLSTVTSQPPPAGGKPLISFADSLRSRGIEISRAALIAALHNADPEIRSLAALKLAEDRDHEAVPSIESAVHQEKEPRAKINMATALWNLGDSNGLSALRGMCSDPSLPIDITVDAVQKLDMLNESNGQCAGTVLSFADSHRDPESCSQVLPALPGVYRWASPKQANHVLRVLQSMLKDESPHVRMEASHSLAEVGSPLSIDAIRKAVLTEQNSVVRTSLTRDLSSLEKRK